MMIRLLAVVAAVGTSSIVQAKQCACRLVKVAGIEMWFTPVCVVGGLDKESVRRVVRAHINEMRGCAITSAATPATRRKLILSFTIQPTGKVREIEADVLQFNQEFMSCVVERVNAWRFPSWSALCSDPEADCSREARSIRVHYPIVFRPPPPRKPNVLPPF
jgi:hypothetical protein